MITHMTHVEVNAIHTWHLQQADAPEAIQPLKANKSNDEAGLL